MCRHNFDGMDLKYGKKLNKTVSQRERMMIKWEKTNGKILKQKFRPAAAQFRIT